MATEKFFVFNEDGALKRLKGRIVRYLDNEDPTGSDKSAIRTSLEVSPDAAGLVQADVGTAPNEIPVNGMLGDMAYQSSDGVSMGVVEADSLSVGNVGDGYSAVADELVVGDEDGSGGMTIVSDSGNSGSLFFADGTSSSSQRSAGKITYNHSADQLQIGTANTAAVTIDSSQRVGIGDTSPDNKLTIGEGNIQLQGNKPPNVEVYHINWKNTNSTGFDVARIAAATGANIYEGELRFMTKDSGGTMATRWSISPSGNLVSSGGAIDFGSVAGGTGTPTPTTGGLLNDYESGTWTPAFGGSVTAPTGSATVRGRYVKIGDQVTCWFFILMPGSGVASGSGELFLNGLPFQTSNSSAQDRFSGVVSYSNNFGTSTGAPTSLIVSYNRTYAQFTVYENSGGKVAGTVYADAADVSFGTAIIGSLSYTTT